MPPRSKSFDTTVDQTILYAPTVTTGGAQKRGLPFFTNADTDEPEPFDIIDLKAAGRINGTILCILGSRAHGKTSTAIALALRTWVRSMGGRRLSVAIHDIRRNNARPEYARLVKLLQAVEVPLDAYQLNQLAADLNLAFAELLEMISDSLEFELGHGLGTKQLKALRYGLKMMLELFPAEGQIGLLMACLRRLSPERVAGYQSALEQALHETVRDSGALEALLSITPRETDGLLDVARELADTIENLLDGQYGRMFGGKHSLGSIMRSNRGLVAFDFSKLSDDALTQVLSMMWRVKTSAMLRGDHSLFYDIEIHDESYTLWRNLIYARAMHKFFKQIRATSTIVIMNTHRLSDYKTVGSETSEQYKLATSMIDDIDLWLLGRHTATAAEETARHLDLTWEEKERLKVLERGVWGLKIGSEPVRWVRLDLTEIEADITFSEEATREMAVEAGGLGQLLQDAWEEEIHQEEAEEETEPLTV